MKIAILASLLVLASAGRLHASAPDAIPALMAARLAEADSPACVALAHVAEKTRVHFACGPDADPMSLTNDALFEIGSITKGLTGLLLADMVRRGELALDDPAAKHSRPGAKLPARGGREITLRHLVTHTAGLPRLPPGMRPADWEVPYADFDADALYAALARTEVARDIGLSSEYSNFGFMWLSEILARRGGKPFDELLAERILRPLGMATAAVRIPVGAPRVAGHDAAYRIVPRWSNAIDLSGVGGVSASIDDMARLAEALAGRRATPLDETIKIALTPLHRLGDPSRSIGYAWFLSDSGRVGHGGGTGGFRASLEVDRTARTGTVALSDSTESFEDLARHLLDPVMPLKRRTPGQRLDADAAAHYHGRYALTPTFAITVFSRAGRLFGQATRQPPIEMRALGNDRFQAVGVDAYLQFQRAADGRAESLTLIQGGRETTGRRSD